MELLQRLITQVKDMFSRKTNLVFYFGFIIIAGVFSFSSKAEEISEVIDYLANIENLSVSFLQSNNNDIAEGKIYIGNKRIRVEYKKPANILLILDKKKGMYYNYELEEIDFFNTQNTSAWFFYEIFKKPEILNDSKIKRKNQNIILKKNGINEVGYYDLEIFFEVKPLVIRKIILEIDDETFILSMSNHVYNDTFSSNFFKLIDPRFFN